jgi:XTP/dITP diphosphohydrolase
MNLKTLVIATHNRKKAGEMIQILSDRFPDLELRTLADYEGAPEPEETGVTYAENAAIKAVSAARFTGEWSLADDAGLEVDGLDGAPGLYSKRFAGEETPFPEKSRLLLEKLEGVSDPERSARFRCCVALSDPHEDTTVFEATCEGCIARSPQGSGGFGYDPVFFLPDIGRTMAELTPQEKHAVSHRGKVLRLLGDHLDAVRSSSQHG